MRKVSLYVCLLLGSLYANGQQSVKEDKRFAGLDKILNDVLHDWHAAGFAVAVVEKDKIIYAKGFGYRDYEKKLPVTPNTLFAIGSSTKAFTSALMGILRQDGKLDFETPVRNYLPELVFNNDDLNAHVTLRDMMTHRTGISRYDLSWYLFGSTSRDSLLQRVRYMIPNEQLRYKWQYNNFMFLAEGMVADKLTKKSWEENLRSRILDSLGMTQTSPWIEALQKGQDVSLGYGLKNDSLLKKLDYRDISIVGPAGSINSNVNEMSNWLITWINGGKFKGKQVLPASYVAEAKSVQMTLGSSTPDSKLPDTYDMGYGFGWFINTYRGHYLVEHGGNIDGFSALTSFLPTDSIGIVVLSNQNTSFLPEVVRNIIADRLLDKKTFDWNGTKLARIKKMRAQNNIKTDTAAVKVKGADVTRAASGYEGTYANNAFGKFYVDAKGDSLFFTCTAGKDYLQHIAYDIFQTITIDKVTGVVDTTDKGIKVKFLMDLGGNITGADMELMGPDAVVFKRTPKAAAISKEELTKYTGAYVLPNMEVTISLKDENQLMMKVPGQPDYTLIPLDKDKFLLKELNGFSVEFQQNEKNEITALTAVQPNGRFTAKKK
jgi:CubicO group peptidase (beta-lactamase class C family)